MVTYIYFVKCPNCEDEHFDFFDEAKEFALGCLSNKPIITQTEVDRNDFGECTSHCDLGTVWSWEDAVGKETDAEPAKVIFTKDDLKDYIPDEDPEFQEIDFATVNTEEQPIKEEFISVYDYGRMTKTELYDHLAKGNEVEIDIGDQGYTWEDTGSFSDGGRYSNSIVSVGFEDGKFNAIEFYMSDDGDEKEGSEIIETESFDELWDTLLSYKPEALVEKYAKTVRKPIPEGMTIEQLVEEMEENENTVECTWCNDLFDKSECRKEVDLGWLCSRCEAAIKSRGETLTFKENNYWDFLDEEVEDPEIVDNLGNTYDGRYPEDELEDADNYRNRLELCPECGKETFDIETGICVECGFN